MPEIFRAFGFSFLFFSREHEPIHLHVIGKDGNAKFVLRDGKFYLDDMQNIKAGDMKKIKAMIEENTDIIIRQWRLYFKTDK